MKVSVHAEAEQDDFQMREAITMPQTTQAYQSLLTAFIQKHMTMIGPGVIASIVRRISGISITNTGVVNQLSGDPVVLLQQLQSAFVPYAGSLTQQTLTRLCNKHSLPIPTDTVTTA